MQKHVNLIDLVKSFPTKIFLQNLASIQTRTSPVKFAHFANLSTKVRCTRYHWGWGGVGRRVAAGECGKATSDWPARLASVRLGSSKTRKAG